MTTKKDIPHKQPTIKDIAKALAIHHSTVSRALRNHPDINPETKEIILDKAKELNYVPNSFAKSLRNNKSKTIALLVPDITAGFFAKTTGIFTNLAYEAGYSMMICQSNEDVEWEKKNVDMILQNRVAGVIATLCKEKADLVHMKNMEQSGTPMVYFDRVPNKTAYPRVVIDNFSAAYMATEKLISMGRKSIGFYVGKKEIEVFNDRLKGYKKAMKDHGLKIEQNMIFSGELKMKNGRQLAQQICKRKKMPGAIICAVDQVAIGLIQELRANGKNIPRDMAVIGFDNDPESAVVEPGLSTFDHPVEDLCHAAFELLMQSINEKKLDPKVIKSYKMKYVERKSM